MQERLEKRVTELEDEYRAGQEMLAELDAKRADLHQTLLRISGAIQVLKEMLEADPDSSAAAEASQSMSPPPHDPAHSPRLVAG